MTPAEFLSRLNGVSKSGAGYEARCPAHEDNRPSLTVSFTDDRILLNCHAGCEFEAICAATGVTPADLFFEPIRRNGDSVVATYDYVDEAGRLLFQVVRSTGKRFRQRHRATDGEWVWSIKGVRRVLYRLPAVMGAVVAGRPVYIVEGEKDVHSVEKAGGVATCNPMGAGKWDDDYSRYLIGADVIVVADKDDTGRHHAEVVAASLRPVAKSVALRQTKEGKDVTDHLAAGFLLDDLDELDQTSSKTTEETKTPDRPEPHDVACWAETPDDQAEPAVVEDLLYRGQLIGIAGEEGDGKTLLAQQVCHQLARHEPILGAFPCGQIRPRRILFVDTEMTEDDARPRALEMARRGLAVDPNQLWWVCTGPLDLARFDDRTYIDELLERYGADFVWIDAGGSAVEDPKDDLPVRAFFAWLQRHLQTGRLVAGGITLHPRKRGQGEYGRRFDDLFGSREWKGRLSKALFVDGNTVTFWKDRGHHLHRRYPAQPGDRYPKATLARPGVDDPEAVPFELHPYAKDHPTDEAAIRTEVLELLSKEPDRYTKTAVVGLLKVQKAAGFVVVNQLLADEIIGPNHKGATLRVLDLTSSQMSGTQSGETAGQKVLELTGTDRTYLGGSVSSQVPSPVGAELEPEPTEDH